MRIAIHKYYKNRIADDMFQAVYKFFVDNLSKFINNYDSHAW